MVYLLGLVTLGLLVALHELGHLVVARCVGLRAQRFSLGFGPQVVSFRLRDTEYVLGLVPLGGSVRIPELGPLPAGTVPPPAWKRLAVVLAGPLANALFALAVLFALYTRGTHVPVPLTVGTVAPGSEAARAQVQPGDRIVRLEGEPLESWSAFVERVARSPGQELHLVLERRGVEREAVVRPRVDEQGQGRIGVSQQYVYQEHAPGEALWLSLAHMGAVAGETLGLVERLLQGREGLVLATPEGLARQTAGATTEGSGTFLRILVGLSIGLALLYLLPLPALDGGRLLFLGFELFTRRRVPPRVETVVHAVGFMALVGVLLAIVVMDVRRRLAPPPVLTTASPTTHVPGPLPTTIPAPAPASAWPVGSGPQVAAPADGLDAGSSREESGALEEAAAPGPRAEDLQELVEQATPDAGASRQEEAGTGGQ